jgi:hypothetical protein
MQELLYQLSAHQLLKDDTSPFGYLMTLKLPSEDRDEEGRLL